LPKFSNKTGDPLFYDTLRQAMTVSLEQSPFLSLISNGRIQQTLRLMGLPAGAPLTPEIADAGIPILKRARAEFAKLQ
jgi:hypothetical protein